jgi:outer membrane immunogenic protein
MRLIMLGMLAATSLVALAVGGARAADLPPAYKAPPVAPAYSWTGLYVGANIGYGWGQAKYDATLTGIGAVSQSEDMDGVIGGLQSGYNYQMGNWVLGFESDFQLSGQRGGSTFPGIAALTTITTDVELEWFGTSRTRIGFLATPNILLYGTGGVAYGKVSTSATVTTVGVGTLTASFEDVKAGWTVGAGIEGAFGGGWSAKLEYLYIDLGRTEHSFGTVALGTIATETRRTTDNIVRVGLNYRWGG